MHTREQAPSSADRRRRRLAGWVLMTLANAAAGQSASPNFAITRQSIDGGSQRAASASFELSGSIGQADAGAAMTNSTTAIQGGFHRAAQPSGPLPDALFASGFEAP